MTDELDDLLRDAGDSLATSPAKSRAAVTAREGSEVLGSPIVAFISGVLIALGAGVAVQGTNRPLNALAYFLCGVVPAVLVSLFRRSTELRSARRRVSVPVTTVRASVALIIAAVAVSALNAYMFASFYL